MYRKPLLCLIDGVALRLLAISLSSLGGRLDVHFQQCASWTVANDGSIVCYQHVPTYNFVDRVQVLSIALTALSYVIVLSSLFFLAVAAYVEMVEGVSKRKRAVSMLQSTVGPAAVVFVAAFIISKGDSHLAAAAACIVFAIILLVFAAGEYAYSRKD